MPFEVKDFLKKLRKRGVSALIDLSKDEQAIVINWAQDVINQYGSILKKYPMKIKNIVELPFPKQDIKIAIKILLPAYIAKGSDDIVNLLKDRYVSLSAFQEMSRKDKETVIKESNEIDQKLESTDSARFPIYHKYMELIISKQKVLLEDINAYINDLQALK